MDPQQPNTAPPPRNIPLGLRIIGIMKLLTATLLAITALGSFKLINSDVADVLQQLVRHLHLDPYNHWLTRILAAIVGIDQKHLKAISAVTFCYALLYTIEGIGLLLGKHWAEYMVIIITGSLLPFELYEVNEKTSLLRVMALAINIGVIIYLVYQLASSKRSKHPKA